MARTIEKWDLYFGLIETVADAVFELSGAVEQRRSEFQGSSESEEFSPDGLHRRKADLSAEIGRLENALAVYSPRPGGSVHRYVSELAGLYRRWECADGKVPNLLEDPAFGEYGWETAAENWEQRTKANLNQRVPQWMASFLHIDWLADCLDENDIDRKHFKALARQRGYSVVGDILDLRFMEALHLELEYIRELDQDGETPDGFMSDGLRFLLNEQNLNFRFFYG